MGYKDNIEEQEITGDELLEQGIDFDTYRNPIIPGTEYLVKIQHKIKKMAILSKQDWKDKNQYELGDEIERQGGLVNWFNFGYRLGFFESINDCIESIEELITFYGLKEEFGKAINLQKELQHLKTI
jgi:hypothetical protein